MINQLLEKESVLREKSSLQNRWSLKSYRDPHYNPILIVRAKLVWINGK